MSKNSIGFSVRLRFNLIQHSRDSLLIKSLVDYMGCGRFVLGPEGENHCQFIVSSLAEITKTLIPFFEKYQIKGVKYLDYSDFCKVALIMQNKEHLTKEGLEQIKLIQLGMNRNRIV